jgi:hypothetical protein
MTYLPYAGIGSRSTPTHIQSIMRHIGSHLASQGWTLRSGGANGADTAFEVGADDQSTVMGILPRTEIYLPWAGFNNNPSPLYPRNIPFSDEEIAISMGHHPAWDKCSPSARIMHQRNLRQMIGHQSVCGDTVQVSKFVVCWTEGGKMIGGTSQALRLAKALQVPVINLGQAINEGDLEAMVREIDALQNQFKKEATDAVGHLPIGTLTPA